MLAYCARNSSDAADSRSSECSTSQVSYMLSNSGFILPSGSSGSGCSASIFRRFESLLRVESVKMAAMMQSAAAAMMKTMLCVIFT